MGEIVNENNTKIKKFFVKRVIALSIDSYMEYSEVVDDVKAKERAYSFVFYLRKEFCCEMKAR
ncbi:MAG: hypothetical protein OXL41_06405 [Nitrospinae bacterium]|nr:hypothetical protein [Nitrospinota bacterium]